MDNPIAKFCKVLSYIIGILGVIITLFTVSQYRLGGAFLYFILSLLSYLIIATVLYALGEIIELLESNSFKISSLKQPVISNLNSNHSNGKISFYGEWICSKCNTRNLSTSLTCKDCGTYK